MADNPYAKYVQQDEPNPYEKYLKPDNRPDFTRGAGVAMGQIAPLAEGALGLLGATGEKVFGEGGLSTGLKNWGLKGYQEGMAKLQPEQKDTDELTTAWDRAKNGDLGALVDWAQYGLGYGAGQLLTAGATSVVGGLIGSAVAGPAGGVAGAAEGAISGGAMRAAAQRAIAPLVEKEIAKITATEAGAKLAADQVTRVATANVAKSIGQSTALYGYAGMQEAGSIYPEAEEQAKKERRQLDGGDLARIWATTAGAAALEGFTDKLGLDALSGKVKIGGKGGLASRAAVGGVAAATGEAATEGAQTFLERVGAGKSLTDEEAQKDYINSAGLGAIGGAPVGVISGALNKPQAQPGPAPDAGIDQSLDRLQAARDAVYLGGQSSAQTVASVVSAPSIDAAIDSMEGVSPSMDSILNEKRGAYLAPLMDRQAELTQQANEAGTSFDRQSALDQAAVSLEQNLPARQGVADQYADLSPMDERTAKGRLKALRDMTANEGGDALSLSVVPHPGVEGKFAIGRAEMPSLELPTQQPAEVSQQDAQQRLATASVQGDFNQSRESFENKLQQQGLTRALQSIEQRNGVATPEEAQLLDRFYPGQKLYDSIQGQPAAAAPQASARDEAVGEARAQLIQQRMDRQAGLGQPETPTQPLVLDNGVRQREPGRENRLERVNSSVEYIPAPGIQATTSLGAAPESQPGIQPNAPLDVATPRDAKPTNTDGLSLVPLPTASESASDARMAELQAQRQQKQAEQDASNAAAAAKQPAAPTVNQTIAALRTIPALRTAEQKAVVSTAMARMTPDQIGLLQRAATMPQGLSSEERLQLRGMRDAEVKASEQRADAATVAPGAATVAPGAATVAPGAATVAPEATQQGKPVSTLGNITVVDPTTLSTQSKTSGGTISRQTHRMVSLMGSMFGKKVVLFSSDNDMAPDGFVRKGDSRTIHLNVKSQVSHLVVFGHELLHQLKADNSGAYDALAKVIKLKAGADTNVAGIRGDMEELTADVVGNRFRETEFWQDVFREILASGTDQRVSQRAAMRLGASVVRAVDKMVKALKGMTGFSTDSMVENLAEVKTAVTKALASYAQEKRGEATQLIQEERNALGQESQQGSVQQERGSRNESGRAAEAGPGDRLLSTAQGQAAEGEKRQSVEERIRAAGAAARSEMGLRFSDKRPGQMDNVEAYHYSQAPRRTLSSSMFGTGLKGSGREEYLNAQDQRRRQRISFYFDKGTGVRPEAGLGGYPHKASLNNVYDINEDPLNLRAGTQAQTEKNVLDAGFNGYMDRMEGTQPGQVVMLGKQDIPVQPLPPGTKIKPGATYNTVETSKTWAPVATNLTREEAQQRVSRMKATIGWRGYEIRVVPAGPRMAIEVLPIPEPEVREEAGVRASDKRDPLPGAPDIEGATGPDVALVAVAEKYARDNGIDLKRQSEYVDVDENFARLVSREWERVEHSPNDPRVRRAYAELARQTMAQYQALTDAGYKFWFYGENNDPYNENPWNAMRALREDKAMAVFSTKEGYGNKFKDSLANGGPMLADTGLRWGMGSENGPKETVYFNDLFRAVHDAFGHGIEGSGFRARGEENAWQAHVRLFTGDAIGALTSETRGQNSWLNYGPYGLANRTAKVKKVVFADQKVGLMPSWTWTELRVGDMAEQGDDVLASAKRVVNTPEFKRWFGDSKVVDGRGRPLVLYHGTKFSSIFKFQGNRGVAGHFAFEPKLADEYAYAGHEDEQELLEQGQKDFGDGGQVYPVYLSAQNIFDARNPEHRKAIGMRYKDGDSFGYGDLESSIREIKRAGFDAYYDIEYTQSLTPADQVNVQGIAVFNPTQIKSAIGNNGQFDPTNPDIRKSEKRILLNIGLSTKEVKGGGLLTEDVVLSALTKLGLTVDSMPVHPSDTEPTAIPAIDRPLTQEEGDDLSVRLNQQSIVQRMPDGSGVLFGPMADEWAPYNPAYFVMRDGRYAIEHEAEVKASAKRRKTQEVGIEVPTTVDRAADSVAAFKRARGKVFETNRELKTEIQDAVRAAAEDAGVDLSTFSAETEKYLVRIATAEAVKALRENANAIGWYREKVTKALRIAALKHPELNTDPQSRMVFIWALAVTSNGMRVKKNFELADKAYSSWKRYKKFPTNIGQGTAKKAINNGLRAYNVLSKKMTFEQLHDAMLTKTPVAQIGKLLGIKPSGEYADTIVYGSAILGPKVGNGFFANLYGHYEQLTIDRWLMRTWGRWTGTLVEVKPDVVAKKADTLSALMGLLTADQRTQLEQAIGRTVYDDDLEPTAAAISSATVKESVRDALDKIGPVDKAMRARLVEILGKEKANSKRVSLGDEIRKAGIGLNGAIDGQVEAPRDPQQRNDMRKVFEQVLTELQKTNPGLTMSDLQAVLWYPEKRIYDAAKTSEETDDGYEDGAAPDYANAAAEHYRGRGVAKSAIDRVIAEVDAELQAPDRAGRGGRSAGGVAQQPGGLTASEKRSPLGFYSALAKGVSNIQTKAAPAAGWRDAIKGLVNKGQVKADEVEWSGINDWLDLQQGKVTKDQVAEYLEQGGVKVEETVLGVVGLSPQYQEEMRELQDLRRRAEEGQEGVIDDDELDRLRQLEQMAGEQAPTKYNRSPYVLPGGENYREVLLTLPGGKEIGSYAQWLAKRMGITPLEAEDTAEYEDDGLHAQFMVEESRAKNSYHSSHWDQPNVLAHIRLNDRTDADGNKVLFVEELQSDWGQEGKKKGFALTEAQRKNLIPGSPEAIAALGRGALGEMRVNVQDQGFAPMQQTLRGPKFEGVPTAPFVTKTEGWLNLALKRVMVMAAEGGYDKVAFVNGEQSADRYDLSKQISQVTVKRFGGTGDWTIKAYDEGGSARINKSLTDLSQLDDHIGKDAADKARKQIEETNSADLRGLDLKVGGEGMKAFYDKIVPIAVNKLLPKVGGGKLGTVFMGEAAEYRAIQSDSDGGGEVVSRAGETISFHDTAAEARDEARRLNGGTLGNTALEQPGFDVTDKMRDAVSAGLPLFSEKRDQTDTPQFKRWFGDSKVVEPFNRKLVVEGREYESRLFGGAYRGTFKGRIKGSPKDRMIAAGRIRYNAIRFKLGLPEVTDWTRLPDELVQRFTGKPLVVYHGTDDNFSEFNTPEIYLAEDRTTAEDFGDRLVKVYASITNPLEYDYADGPPMSRKQAMDSGYDGFKVLNYEVGDEINENEGAVWVAFNSTQVKSATENNGNFDPTNPDIRKSEKRIFDASGRTYTPEQKALFENVGRTQEVMTLRERIANLRKDLGKKLAQGIADQFMPIKELGRYGKEAYMLARLSKGTAGAVEALLHHGKLKLVDGVYDADQTGGALNEVFMPLRNETSDWLWWVAANRADRLAKEDRENLFTPQGIAAGKTLSDGTTNFDYTLRNGQVTRDRTLIFRDALQKYDEFNQNVLDIAEQSGLISSDVRAKIAHAMYVPFYRQSEDGTAAFAGGASGAIVRQEAFKALKGGTDKLQSDLLQNVLSNWGHIIDASAKNRAALASVKAAEDMGVAIEADEATVRDMAKASGNRKGVVWVKDQGEKRFFLVEDPYVLSAITSLEYSGMKGPIMDALSAFKHALTIGVTASPAFKIRNLIRDSVQAVASAPLSANLLQNLRDGVAASNKDTQTYVSALASGGLIRFGTMLEGSASARMRQLIRMGTSEDTILNSDNKVQAVRDKFEKYFMAYSELGNRSEEINRSALYKQLTDKGVSHAEASLAARDLMDFSMQGTWTSVRFLTQVVPFMNARIQGLYKLGRAAKEDPRRFAAVLGAVTLASIALAAAYKDDDDWKKREDWDRDNFWWFKVGGVAYRIPKPFEIGAMATMAERGADFLWDKNMTGARYGKIVKDLLMDNLSFSPIPQGVKPILDVYANKDSFTGRPIETMGMERLAPDYRFNQGTSMFSRALSTAGQSVVNATGLNKAGAAMLSPIQVDHLIQGYFGWLGSFVVGGSDMALRPLTGQPARPTADYYKLATQGIVQEVSSGSSYFVSSLYDQAKVLDQSYATWRELLKQNKVQEAKEYFDSNKADIIRARSVDRVKSGEAKFNEMIRMIERSSKDPDVKKAEIQKVRDMQDRLARVLTEVR